MAIKKVLWFICIFWTADYNNASLWASETALCVCVGVSPPVCLCLRKSYSTVTDSTSETPLAYLQQDRAHRKEKLEQLYIHTIKEVPH